MSNDQYKWPMQHNPIRFFRPKGLKHHLYCIHTGNDTNILNKFGFNKRLISNLCCEVNGHLYEYVRSNDQTLKLYKKDQCSSIEIKLIEAFNEIYEEELRKRQKWTYLQLMENYRKTIQPELDSSQDVLPSNVRLSSSLWY